MFQKPSHYQINQQRGPQGNKRKINKTQPDFCGSYAQLSSPPFANPIGLHFKKKQDFLNGSFHLNNKRVTPLP